MDGWTRSHVVVGAAVVALGAVVSLVTSTIVASRAYERRGKLATSVAQEITVKGSARTRVRSDLASWSITVRGEAKDLAGAFEQVETGVRKVVAYLRERGFEAAELRLGSIDTTTHYVKDREGRDTREVSAISLERTIAVTTPHVDRVHESAPDVTRLLGDGVRLTSSSPAYYYTKAADLKVAILGDASRDARTRADEIASKAGCRVGEVRRAQMGVIQIVQPNSTEVSSYGAYDTSTRDKDVFVVVSVTFGVET
jgi:hypothetical protein